MPNGTFVVDPAASFTAAFLMAVTPREKFGQQGQQDHASDGTPKWTCIVAVTFAQVGNAPVQSDVLSITVTQPNDPSLDLTPGMPVVLDGMRVGVSAPERKENGKGIAGGKAWFQASGIRSAAPSFRSSSKTSSENAA